MKTYNVTFLPHGREDKEWMLFNADNKEDVKKYFTAGVIINIEETIAEEWS